MQRRYRTLADYFEQTGTSQRALARQLGISKAYISLITSGDRQPSLPLAIRIVELTGVPMESLVVAPLEVSR